MGTEACWQNLVRRILRAKEVGGIQSLALQAKARTKEFETVVEAIAQIWLEDHSKHGGDVSETATLKKFFELARAKLGWEVRHLAKCDLPSERMEAIFIRNTGQACARALGESRRTQKRAALFTAQAARQHAEEIGGHNRPVGEEPPILLTLEKTALSTNAKLAVLLALYWLDSSPLKDAYIIRDRLNLKKLAKYTGLQAKELRESQRIPERSIAKVKRRVPPAFWNIDKQLSKLAASRPQGVAGLDLRQQGFDLARSLAAGFAPENLDTPGVAPPHLPEFDETVDLLLDEYKLAEVPRDREIVERLMQSVVRLREALGDGDLERTFALAGPFVLDAARLQQPLAPERLQICLAYTYLLKIAGWVDACLQGLKVIERRCNEIVKEEGIESLDYPAELDHGLPLRRVRTFVRANSVLVSFYYKLTTAGGLRFRVRDYQALSRLTEQLQKSLADDPRADTIGEDLLVIRAHTYRAAYNRARRCPSRSKHSAENEKRLQQRKLLSLISRSFWDSNRDRPDARRLVEAAHNAGEGYAADRTLDILEQLLRHWGDEAAEDLIAERVATTPMRVKP
ncbi:MAG: hypothetical protein JSV78_09910 [Phycisphaerales bacterium]|nr:MAG: hypothetical protein JSV78_09910 [Phycisphaerales bacterium]